MPTNFFQKYAAGITVLLLCGFLLTCIPVANAAVDLKKMQRDLDILKVVLDRLLRPNTHVGHLGNGDTRALYLDGVGVIFIYQYSTSNQLVILGDVTEPLLLAEETYREALEKTRLAAQEKIRENQHEQQKIVVHDLAKPEKLAQYQAQARQQEEKLQQKIATINQDLRENVSEFLTDYCDAINQLQPEERITVMVFPNESVSQFSLGSFYSQKSPTIEPIIASLKKGDLNAYRREALSRENLVPRIQFVEKQTEPRLNKDIQIMKTIFNAALKENEQTRRMLRGESRGMYLENFGALFLLNTRDNFQVENSHLFANYSYAEALAGVAEDESLTTKNESDAKPRLAVLKTYLIEILGNYGHTLRRLKADEWIGIALDLKDFIRTTDLLYASNMLLKVRAGDTFLLNQGKIDFADFKQRVVITEY
ncbi:hypothetical protein L0128_10470 [candidate division KSB1 bacterium]|nr:hypothetical protein [candidate division KSB1 bacterium]